MPKVVHYYICSPPAKQGSNEISRSRYQQLGDALEASVGGGRGARGRPATRGLQPPASEQQLGGKREGGNGSGPEARGGGGGGAPRQLVAWCGC